MIKKLKNFPEKQKERFTKLCERIQQTKKDFETLITQNNE